MKYKVIKDTREKLGWDFEENLRCSGTIISGLKTGDYTLEGLENTLCIERKYCVSEIANNLGAKHKPFFREILRMEPYEYAFIICEFSMSELISYPYGSNLSKKIQAKIKMSGNYLLSKVLDIQLKTNVQFLFCDNRSNAIEVAKKIFNKVSL